MEEVGKSTPGDSSETDLLEMSQIAIRQLKESRTREMKLQEEIRILKKQQEIQNGPAATNQQHGVQELHQQITELTQQFRQLKSVSDEKVQRLSNEVARLEVEAKDKDAKIKDMTVLGTTHQSTIDGVRMDNADLKLDLERVRFEQLQLQNQLTQATAEKLELGEQIQRLSAQRDELVQNFAAQVNEMDKTARPIRCDEGSGERRLPRGSSARKTSNGPVYNDEEQKTLMDELHDSFTMNARGLLSRMDQMARSIHGDEDSGGRACLQPPERARRASAVDTKADVVSRREEPVEDLQRKFDELVSKSEKRLKHIRLLEHERDKMDRKLDEANAQLANRDNQERDRLNTATLELKAQLEKANEANKRLMEKLDDNEWRLANTREALDEAEKRIRETGTADVERKLKEYEEKCVELRRRQREIDDLRMANEEAWRQVDDLRKKNEEMDANIALAINERESAVERIGELVAELQTIKFEKSELQTRIRHLEDDNKRLKERGK